MKSLNLMLLVLWCAFAKADGLTSTVNITFKKGEIPKYVYVTLNGLSFFEKYPTHGASVINIVMNTPPKPVVKGDVLNFYYNHGRMYYSDRPDLTQKDFRYDKPGGTSFLLEDKIVVNPAKQVSGRLNNQYQKLALIHEEYLTWLQQYQATHKKIDQAYYLKTLSTDNARLLEIARTPNDSLAYDALILVTPTSLSGDLHRLIDKRFSPAFKNDPKHSYVFSKLDRDKINTVNLSKITFKDRANEDVTYLSAAAKYTLVDFWATWCYPCRTELPEVVNITNSYKGKGLRVLFVSLDRQAESWKKFLPASVIAKADNYFLPGDFNNPLAKQLNITSIPANVLIDANGNTVATNIHGDQLTDTLKKLMP